MLAVLGKLVTGEAAVERTLGGPILAQAAVPVLPGDSAESLAARVLTQEHRIYPQAIARLLASHS